MALAFCLFGLSKKKIFSVDIFRSLSRSLVPVPRRETLKFISLQKLFFSSFELIKKLF